MGRIEVNYGPKWSPVEEAATAVTISKFQLESYEPLPYQLVAFVGVVPSMNKSQKKKSTKHEKVGTNQKSFYDLEQPTPMEKRRPRSLSPVMLSCSADLSGRTRARNAAAQIWTESSVTPAGR